MVPQFELPHIPKPPKQEDAKVHNLTCHAECNEIQWITNMGGKIQKQREKVQRDNRRINDYGWTVMFWVKSSMRRSGNKESMWWALI